MNQPHPKQRVSRARAGYLEKDPSDWVTGRAPMTSAQASYLKRLCEGAGMAFEARLTKAEASRRIDALRTHPGCRLERRAH
jgi:DUF3072 family protein